MNRKKIQRFLAAMLLLALSFGITSCSKAENNMKSNFSIQSEVTKESTDYLEINLDVPVVSGSESADVINDKISENIATARTQVEEAAAGMLKGEGGQGKAGLGSSFDYSQSGDMVSLWIRMNNYTGGAHGLYWLDTYTFNTATNEIYDFENIFQEGKDYITVINNEIISQINENPEAYFPSAIETVKSYGGALPFYINGNKIVVYFTLYDIAPYAAGIPYFDFEAEELKGLLKPEIYNAIKDSQPIEEGHRY